MTNVKTKSNDLHAELLTRAVDEVIVREHLGEALETGQALRVKLGIDPTARDLHLGHTVPLRKLRAFQDLGHTAVLIIGDFTAMIGDPSGRSEARAPLSEQAVKENMEHYLAQASLVLDLKKTEIRYNSEWYKKGGLALLWELLGKVTVERALERDDFQKRLHAGEEVTLLEVLYPLLQGYDSVAVGADVEIGGSDQKFNLLMGRKIQRRFGRREQDIMTTVLIEGTDGTRKMSKTFGNDIALSATADDMFGRVMSIPDPLIKKYFLALTDVGLDEIEAAARANPRDAKLKLAETVVGMYRGIRAGARARARFIEIFSLGRALPPSRKAEIPYGKRDPVEILVRAGLAPSKAAARRLILQKGVVVDEKKVSNPQDMIEVKQGMIIRVGKRQAVQVK